MWNINAQQGRIPCAIFTKFAEFVPHFRLRYALKFRWIYSRRYGVTGVLSWGVQLPQNFKRPLAAKLCVRSPNVFEVQERARGPLSPCQVWWGSDFNRRRGSQKRWVFCLSFCLFCLSVRHAFGRQRLCDRFRHEGVGVQKRFWYRCVGKVCSCAPVFNFVRLLPTGDTTKCRIPKNGKKWGFSPPQDDRINRSRRNFAGKRNLYCGTTIAHQISPLSVKGGVGTAAFKSVKIGPKLWFFGHRKPTQWTHSDEIWPVSADLGSALVHQIWPSSVKEGRYRSLKNVKICPKLWFLATGSRHNEHIQMKFGV